MMDFPSGVLQVQMCEQDLNAPSGRVLPYVTLTGTCGPKGMVFRVFCLERGIYFTTFCLKQGIAT